MCGVAICNDMESIKKRERTIKSKEIDSFVNMWSIKWMEKQAESEKERERRKSHKTFHFPVERRLSFVHPSISLINFSY